MRPTPVLPPAPLPQAGPLLQWDGNIPLPLPPHVYEYCALPPPPSPRLKRAGLDYWDSVCMSVHASWDAFFAYFQRLPGPKRLVAFTVYGTSYYAGPGGEAGAKGKGGRGAWRGSPLAPPGAMQGFVAGSGLLPLVSSSRTRPLWRLWGIDDFRAFGLRDLLAARSRAS